MALLAALALGAVATGSSVGASASQQAENESRGAGPPGQSDLQDELPDERTRTTRTYSTVGGGRVTRFYAGAVNYRDGDTWRAIDNRLRRDARGRIRNTANRYDLELPADLDAGFVRVTANESAVAFRLLGADATPTIEEATATYRAALPGVDVRYDAMADGVKETLVLRDRAAPRAFRFQLELTPNLRAALTHGGAMEFRDDEGRLRFASSPPVAWDAATEDSPTDHPVRFAYDPARKQLLVTLDDAYVDSPDRRFPISIDPWITLPTDGRDCTLSARLDEQQSSFCTSQTLHVGTVASPDNHDHTALLDFDAAENLPEHITILEAFPTMFVKSEAGTDWHQFAMSALTRPFVVNAATWRSPDGAVPWKSVGGDFNPVAAHLKWMGGGGANKKTYWPMPDQMQRWADGTDADYGLVIRPTAANPPYGVVFSSTEDIDPTRRPFLDVNYQPIMGRDGPFSFVYENVGESQAGVNVASGRLTVTARDAALSAAGPGFDLLRFYNSADQRAGSPLEKGWKLGAALQLQIQGNGDGTVEFPSGTWARFPSLGTNVWGRDRSVDAALTKTATGWTIERDSGERFLLDANKRLVRRERAGLTPAVTYAYDTSGRLKTVTDGSQGATQLAYGTTGTLATATLPDGRVVSYSISSGRLRSSTVAGATTSYGYDASGRLDRIQAPAGTVKASYDANSRVTSITRVTNVAADTGPTTQFAYFGRTQLAGCPPESAGRTVETRPDGSTITYCYDARLEVIDQSSSSAESPELEDIAAEAYAAEYGVSLDTARATLRISDRSEGLGDELAPTPAGPGYSGIWFDHTQRRVKVGLRTGTDPTPVNQAFAARGLTNDADIVWRPNTQQQLEDERDRLITQLGDLFDAGLMTASFRPSHNDVLVELGTDITVAQRQRVDTAVAARTAPVTVVMGDLPLLRMNEFDCDSTSRCDPPARGGLALYRDEGGIHCTAAFTARRNVTGESRDPRMLTAGHCGLPSGESGYFKNADGDRKRLGSWNPFEHVGTQGDFGTFNIASDSDYYSQNLLRPIVYVTANRDQGDYGGNDGGRTRRNTTYRIKRTARNQLGTTLCMTGGVSGTKCGVVDRVGIPQNGRTYRLAKVRIWNCREYGESESEIRRKFKPGDSGAPGYKAHAAKAIVSGGLDHTPRDRNDPANPSCTIFVSGVKEAERVLNVAVVTGG